MLGIVPRRRDAAKCAPMSPFGAIPTYTKIVVGTLTGFFGGIAIRYKRTAHKAQNPFDGVSNYIEASISANASDHIQCRGRRMDADGRWFHVGDRPARRDFVRPRIRTHSTTSFRFAGSPAPTLYSYKRCGMPRSAAPMSAFGAIPTYI